MDGAKHNKTEYPINYLAAIYRLSSVVMLTFQTLLKCEQSYFKR